jgi:hypothetical protein
LTPRINRDESVIPTPYGDHDGDSWEALCQLVFKQKFLSDGYQAVEASPGDFGLDGFTLHTGCAFQCYCPKKIYAASTLAGKIRKKITDDLGKLQTYSADIEALLSGTILQRWYLITPTIPSNSLLTHARKMQQDVRAWGLPFIGPAFSVELHDGGYYANEIAAVQAYTPQVISVDVITEVEPLEKSHEFYADNLRRKTALRINPRLSGDFAARAEKQLYARTLKEFLQSDAHLRQISVRAPAVYYRLCRLLHIFQQEVEEASATWCGSPNDLTEKLKRDLETRVASALGPAFSGEVAFSVTRDMLARWLAICSLDYVTDHE